MAILTFVKEWFAPLPQPKSAVSSITGVEQTMFSQHAINNTVVMVPANSGMIRWVDNLLCSLKKTSFDTSKIVFWALDDSAKETFESRGFATYRDPHLYSVSEAANKFGNTRVYHKMMRERPKFFIDFLSTGFDLLMIDSDLVFWDSPTEIIPGPESDLDIVYSTDAREWYQNKNAFKDLFRRGSNIPPVCNGFFWMRGTSKTVRIWRDMQDVFEAGWWTLFYQLIQMQDDQRGMDVLLNDGRGQLMPPYPDGIVDDIVPKVEMTKDTVKVKLLDQTEYASGHLIRDRREQYDKNLEALRARGKDRKMVHFNWNSAKQTKEGGARDLGMYLLDDAGKCSHKHLP